MTLWRNVEREMMNLSAKILSPGIIKNLNSYWAMHFCSILEAIYEQNTLAYGFQKPYMENIFPSVENLLSKSGPNFFLKIKDSLNNFGLQTFLAHFLLSVDGEPIVTNIIDEILFEKNINLGYEKFKYGVFIPAKDFTSSERFMSEYNPILINHPNISFTDAGKSVEFADICILLKGENINLGILGEVEGTHGEFLSRGSFWKKKNGAYFSFGIGVKQRLLHPDMFTHPADIVAQWVRINDQNFYIITMTSDYYVVGDFHSAIGTLETLFSMGKHQRLALNFHAENIVKIIRDYWDYHIIDLLTFLRSLIIYSESTLGTNPLAVKSVPKIII